MTNILKLRQGRSISREEYTKAKSEFDDFYQNADEDTRAKLDGLLQSSLNYSSADPMNNRSAREYATQIYKNAVKIGKGEYAEAPGAVASTKNIFNGYSNAENINNANYITSRYLSNIRSSKPASTPSSSQNLYHEYNWAKGLDSEWSLETDKLEDRMSSFANTLASNLREAKNAKASGKDLVGIDESTIDQALAFLNKETWTKDDFKSLMNAAKIAGVDPSAFKNYFGDLFPGVSAEEKAKKVWTDKGYSEVDTSSLSEGIKSALNSNNVRLLKDKDNNYTLAGKDWSEYSGNGFNWIDLNQGDTYGHGILAGTDGKVFLGNTADINDSHWANKLFSDIKNKMYELYNPIYTRKKFNLTNDYSEENLINEYVRGLELAGYKNPDASYTDVSKLFNGTSKVIAYNPDGSELGTGSFGELILSPNTQFIWENADGTISNPSTLEEAKRALGGFNLKGYDTEANEQLGALSDLSGVFEGAEGLSGDTKLTKNDFKKGLLGSIATGIIPYGLYRLFANDTIGNKPQVFVDLSVQALKDPQKKLDVPGRIMDMTGSEFLAQFGTRTQLLETIGRFVNEGAKLSPQDLRWIKNMYYTAEKSRLDSENKTRKHAEGGILYAADGTALFVNQERPTNNWHEKYDKSAALKKEDADIAKAQQEGYNSAEHYRANKNTDHLSTADMMRIGTIAADVTSIIASFTSGTGVGAAVAEGAGLASFGIDTAADIIDPSVSSGEVLKNGLINAGLAAISFIPGAKIPSTLGKVIKYAPKVLLAASAMGITMDESVQNTFKKVTEGKEKLNTEDWRNIAHVFTLVAAGSRAGRQGYEKFRAKKDLKGEAKNVLTVKSGDTNVAEIPVDKKPELDEIKKLAKEGNIEEAQGKLATLLGKTADEVKGFFSENGSVASKVRGKYSLDLKTSEQKAKVDIDKALVAFEQAKYSGNSTWSRLRNAPTWRLRGIMDATGMYPNGIIGNKRTDGVTERMRKKVQSKPLEKNEIPSIGAANSENTLGKYTTFRSLLKPFNEAETPIKNISDVPTAVREKITLPKDARKAALLFAKAFGIEIKSQRDYFRFIQDLQENNPELYSLFLSRRPMVNPARFIALAKQEYNFKDGGKVNYQKLRK